MTALFFLVGAAALIAGAELLVRGAARLATAAGLTPLVIGLTVVAFGTSAPELAVTVGSAWTGQGGMAVGNVVGSNIFNVLLILGLSAAIAPLVVSEQLVRLDVPLMVAASVAVLILALDGRVGRVDGVILFAAVLAYTTVLVMKGRREARQGPSPAAGKDDAPPGSGVDRSGRWPLDLVAMIGGLALLVLGARWLVSAAVEVATALGVSELVVGLTIVAAGTSLPEVATSVLASLRGQRDIAVGNVVGSNLFNLLAVLGVGGLVAPDGIPVSVGALTFDIPVMIGVAVATLPIAFTGYVIARWEGLAFLGFYAAYTAFLVLQAAEHPAVDQVGTALLYFVLPLTALTLIVLATRAFRKQRTTGDT